MKKMSRIAIVLISIFMLLAMIPAAVSMAAGVEPNVTMTVDKTTVEAGDEITVELANPAMNFQGLSLKLKYDPELVECTAMLNVDGDDGDDDLFMYYLNSKGKEKPMYPTVSDLVEDMADGQFSFAMMPGEDTDFVEGTIVTFTFVALKDGDVTFTLEEHCVGEDAYKGEISHKVTIGLSAPACEHENTTTTCIPAANKQHTVTVTCDGCGETVGTPTTENCTGTDDNDCTTAVECQHCEQTIIEAKTHVDGDDKNHACDNAGCTVDNVDGGHTPAADDGDCTTAIHCTECDAVTTEAKTHVDGDDKNHACDNAGCNVDNVDGGHTPAADDGDCTTAIHCTECDAVTTEAKTHVDGDDKNHACDNEGCTVDNVSDCSDKDDDGDHNCDVCGKPDVTDHAGNYYFNWSWDEDNLSWEIYLGFYCPECDTNNDAAEVYDEPELVTTPTCTVNGVYAYSFDFSNVTLPAGWVWENFELSSTIPKGAVWNAETKILTYEMTWKTDPDNHASDEIDYKNITDTQHTAYHSCCGAEIETVNHTYVDGVCACEKVKTLNVTVDVPGFQENVIFTLSNTTATFGQDFVTTVTVNKGTGIIFTGTNALVEYCTFDEKTGTLTIPANAITANMETIEIGFMATVKQTIDLNGGVMSDSYKETMLEQGAVIEGDKITLALPYGMVTTLSAMPESAINKTGYTYNGLKDQNGNFYNTGAEYIFLDEVTFTIQWEANTYTITWTINGKFFTTTNVEYGAVITVPAYALPEGHTFSDWDVPATMPAENLTIDATLTVNTYTLTVYDMPTAVGNADPKEFTVPYGTNILEFINGKVDLNNVDMNNDLVKGYHFWLGYWMDYNNWITVDEDSIVSGNIEITAASAFHGWQRMSTDDPWSYQDMGAFVTGWHEVDGEWYYFFMNEAIWWNYPATGITRVPYPTEKINGVTYEPDAVSDTFIDAYEAWFIFDENGKFQSAKTGMVDHNGTTRYAVNGMIPWHYGFATDGSDYYYFIGDAENGGNMLATGDVYMTRPNGLTINGKTVYEKGVYTFGADGKLCLYNGVTKVGDALRYYYDYCYTAKRGLIAVEVEGATKYIYVKSSTANLVANAQYYIPAGNAYDIVSGMYTFDENGYMIDVEHTDKNGIFFEDGAYYYYEEGVRAYAGLIQYTGTASDGTVYTNAWIYVRNDGQLATGKYWITKTNGEMESKPYMFNEYGMMDGRNGIVAENGSLYYYVDGVLAKGTGLIKIGDNYYYVRSTGEVVNNRNYWISNTNEYDVIAKIYAFDENGVMLDVETKDTSLNGVVDGYYYVDGQIQYGAGPIVWEGNVYYVRTNGQVATGNYWTTVANDVLPSGKYEFDETGKLIKE